MANDSPSFLWNNIESGVWYRDDPSGSAKTHTADSAVCTAWSGTTLVLTRADNGVIIDRRGATPKTYCKRAGLDGWRYADGKWEQRAAK